MKTEMRQSGIESTEELCVCNVVAVVLGCVNPTFYIKVCSLEQEESFRFVMFDGIPSPA